MRAPGTFPIGGTPAAAMCGVSADFHALCLDQRHVTPGSQRPRHTKDPGQDHKARRLQTADLPTEEPPSLSSQRHVPASHPPRPSFALSGRRYGAGFATVQLLHVIPENAHKRARGTTPRPGCTGIAVYLAGSSGSMSLVCTGPAPPSGGTGGDTARHLRLPSPRGPGLTEDGFSMTSS